MNAPQDSPYKPRQEAMLVEYVDRLRNHCRGRRAVHVRLSLLKPHNRLDYHVRVAGSLFVPILRKFSGQLFQLANADIVIILPDTAVAATEEVIDTLRQLFEGDPLAQPPLPGERDSFCAWYNLAVDYRSFFTRCRHFAEQAEELPQAGERKKRPLDPELLKLLVEKLETTPILPLLRAQPICAVKPNVAADPLLTEIYTASPELQARLAPSISLSADPWLFQYLMAEIDRKLLLDIPKLPTLPGHGVLSLNISTDALLSEEFLIFDETIRSRTKRSIMLEIHLIDALSDLATYQVARDLARERGYYVAIDALDYMTIRFINRERLDADMFKVAWSPNMDGIVRLDKGRVFREIVKRAEPERIILCHCDQKRAVEVGWSIGITTFQGRYIDELLESKKILRLSEKATEALRLATG